MPEPGIFSHLQRSYSGTAVFSGPIPWIRLAHRLEPFYKMEVPGRRLPEKDVSKPCHQPVELDRIRVVMFGSGPELNPDAKQFLCRLDEHPEIELLGAFCQAGSQSLVRCSGPVEAPRPAGFSVVRDPAAGPIKPLPPASPRGNCAQKAS
jgi:hypothetical protein